jgi:asparagine synthase (glutamine-hydrolysing)
MFRFLALAWDSEDWGSSAHAEALVSGVQGQGMWHKAWRRPGFALFTRGERQGVNATYRFRHGHGLVVGKLFRRSERGTHDQADVILSDADSVRVAHSQGASLVTDFWGRYVAFLPTPQGSTRVLRDPSGMLPCFLLVREGVSVVFSWLEDAIELLGTRFKPSVNWDALAAYILQGELGGPDTCLADIRTFLPGIAQDLATGERQVLWNPLAIAGDPSSSALDDAAHLLRTTARACTAAWSRCYRTLLLRLSGGVDSSILLSCLGPKHTPADVVCVNYHSPGSDTDERVYARMAAAWVGRDLIECRRDPHFRVGQILTMARTPSPVPYLGWMNAGMDARLAQGQGACAMFTGAGGDAVFYEFSMWWTLADYLAVRGMDRGIVGAALDAARLGRVSVWRAIGLALADHFAPPRLRQDALDDLDVLSLELKHTKLDRARFVHPCLVAPSGLPIGKDHQLRALLSPIGYYDPFQRENAAELVTPLLSQPLVELCLSLPTYLLAHGGRGRALARKAFAQDLPARIRTRRSKGGMEEHITEVLQANLAFIQELLLEGQLVRRGMLDPTRLEDMLSGKPSRHAAQLGHVHALVAIEAWLSRWNG